MDSYLLVLEVASNYQDRPAHNRGYRFWPLLAYDLKCDSFKLFLIAKACTSSSKQVCDVLMLMTPTACIVL